MDARLTLEAVEAMVAETRRNAEALDGRPLRRPRPAPRRARQSAASRWAAWR